LLDAGLRVEQLFQHFEDQIKQGMKLETNKCGGILGGISTGSPILLKLAVKPTSSIAKSQKTCDIHGMEQEISVKGRHDPCICPRLVPVAEAMAALVLMDALERQKILKGEKDSLSALRARIDLLDREIVALTAKRMETVREIGCTKKETGLNVEDKAREDEIIRLRSRWAEEIGLDELLVEKIFEELLRSGKNIQHDKE